MILNIFAFKNKKIDCFTQPIYSDESCENYATNTRRSLLAADDLSKIVPYKNLTLYCIGVFDDEKGTIIQVDEDGNSLIRLLYDCGKDVVERICKEKGVKPDEIESVQASR